MYKQNAMCQIVVRRTHPLVFVALAVSAGCRSSLTPRDQFIISSSIVYGTVSLPGVSTPVSVRAAVYRPGCAQPQVWSDTTRTSAGGHYRLLLSVPLTPESLCVTVTARRLASSDSVVSPAMTLFFTNTSPDSQRIDLTLP